MLRPFPEPSDVFVADQAAYLADRLHPLVSVDLSAADPAWSGWVHVLSPVEPVSGYLSEGAGRRHTDMALTNWLGFALEDGRYRFLGEPGYFEVDDVPGRAQRSAQQQALVEHYLAQHASFQRVREAYRQDGVLRPSGPDGAESARASWASDLVDEVGGDVDAGCRWAELEHFELDLAGDVARPVGPDGRRFEFVAGVCAANYREQGAEWVLVFYQPETERVLLSFDWS